VNDESGRNAVKAFRQTGRREWRQFRLLSRDSVRRLLARVVMSRDSDPMQFALWATMLATTPPLVVAVRKITQFAFFQALEAANPAITARILAAERTFFVLYGMLAAALLAALLWEALYPDRLDQEIVGVLPVRPRTLAAARLGAAIGVGLTFTATVNLPAAFLYSVGSLAHDVGPLHRVIAGHTMATMGGSAFLLLALVALRGVVGICAGERMARGLALALQFTTIVLLVDVVLVLPYVVLRLVGTLEAGTASLLPPVWFVALYFRMADSAPAFIENARLAGVASTVAVAAVLLFSLVPAAWIGRRALQGAVRSRTQPVMTAARLVARLCTRDSVVRSLYLFGVASLIRNRRHLLVLARYLGMAIAAAVLSVLAARLRGTFDVSEPRAYLLAIPLVFVFFAIFGLRTAVAIPADIEANWPFRMATPTSEQALRAARLLMVSLGVLPITLVWLIVSATVWPFAIVLRIAALDLVAGLLVMELSLLAWIAIPFATPHEPAPETLKSRWMWYLLFLLIFAKGGASLEFDAVQSLGVTMIYLVAGIVTIAAVRVRRKRQGRRLAPTFETASSPIESLNLSEAVN
jgi:hypothetical protein